MKPRISFLEFCLAIFIVLVFAVLCIMHSMLVINGWNGVESLPMMYDDHEHSAYVIWYAIMSIASLGIIVGLLYAVIKPDRRWLMGSIVAGSIMVVVMTLIS